MYQRTMQGPLRLPAVLGERMRDLTGREVLAVAPLIALMLVLGVYPKPLTDVINPAVEATMQDIGQTDPAPTQGDGAAQTSDGSAVVDAED
jgi:NADH-quinone oxidoreductase subunit M